MRERFFSGSWPAWVKHLPAFLFLVAMIAVSGVLLRPETWRRETHLAAAPIHDVPDDEMTRMTQCLAAVRGEGSEKHPLPLRREPLSRWSDPAQNVSEAALWAWGERGRPYALVMLERSTESGGGDEAGSWGSSWSRWRMNVWRSTQPTACDKGMQQSPLTPRRF